MMKNKHSLKFGAIIIVVVAISNFLARNITLDEIDLFNTTNLFTYFGVLVGFALTIYTFGLSLISDIIEKINSSSMEVNKKETICALLMSGFNQIKDDIWLIFYAIVITILFAILKDISTPFSLDVLSWKVPETVSLSLFSLSTIAMWDIMKTMFDMSEIKFKAENLKKTTTV